MKTLLMNSFDSDGGAARSAYRLHRGLIENNVDSIMMVNRKKTDDSTLIGPSTKVKKGLAIAREQLDSFPLRIYPQRKSTPLSVAWLNNEINNSIEKLNPDIVHLHWINSGFISIKSIDNIHKPIVWTLHDSWPFTGGCHIPFECKNYIKDCGRCPQLNSKYNYDLSRIIWKNKKKYWSGKNITIVTPSKWLSQCAKESSLFSNLKVEVIPNGLDLSKFKPIDKQIARELLNISKDKKIVLFGAMNSTKDANKGFQFLIPALKKLALTKWSKDVELVVFGSSKPANSPEIGFKTHYTGRINDDISLALLYSASDVFIAPSMSENLPNTVMESLACGTPVVAFNIGGMPDLIENYNNGYLAKPFEYEDLMKGIEWIISDNDRWKILSSNARMKIEKEFDINIVAKKYIDLYSSIL